MFFFCCKFTWEYKVTSFSKVKVIYAESPKVEVNKCTVTNCSTSYKTGLKKVLLHFHENQELKRKWIYFVNRKKWLHTARSIIRIDHFEQKFIKCGKKC